MADDGENDEVVSDMHESEEGGDEAGGGARGGAGDGQARRNASGDVPPLVRWPETRLTTIICHHLGYKKFSDLPNPTLSEYGCFMCPLTYLFVFDIAKIQAKDVRHGIKEGRLLRHFRASCRRWWKKEDEELEEQFRRLADIWLAYTAVRDVNGAIADDDMDQCVAEAMPIHQIMSKRLMSLHADATNMPKLARRVFMSAGDVLDTRLPKHMQIAADRAEKAESRALEKLGGGGGGGGSKKRERDEGPPPKIEAGNFWCQACKKQLPKTDTSHRTSEAHLANVKKRN